MKKLLRSFVFLFLGSASAANAQVLKQPFLGSGVSSAWGNKAQNIVTTVGFALIIPVSKKIFLRPLVLGGEIVPLNSAKCFPVMQIGGLVGYKVKKRFSVLSGLAETIQFPKSGVVYLPTGIVSTATRIRGRWGIFTPININARGWSVSLQVGYTW